MRRILAALVFLLVAGAFAEPTGYITYTVPTEGGIFDAQARDVLQYMSGGVTYQLRVESVTSNLVTINSPQGSLGFKPGDSRLLDSNHDGAPEAKLSLRAVNGLHATIFVGMVAAAPRIVSTTGEDLSKSGAVSIDQSGQTLVVDVHKTEQVQTAKHNGYAILWLLLVAVTLGALLSAYAHHHHLARKLLAGRHEHLLLDYVGKLRALGHKDMDILRILIGHGHTDDQARNVLAKAPMIKTTAHRRATR